MSLPTVTVVTTVPTLYERPENWDELHGLELAYESLSHIKSSWEWIIVGPEPIVSMLWATDPRVRLIRTDATGSALFNIGLFEARSPFVIELDGASILLPGFNQLLTELEAHPEAAYGFGSTVDWEYDGDVEVRVPMTYQAGSVPVGDVLTYWEKHRTWWFVPLSTLWRRDHLIAAGGYAALGSASNIVPLIMSSAYSPALAVDAEVYRLARFRDRDATSTTASEALITDKFLQEQLRHTRRFGYRPRL